MSPLVLVAIAIAFYLVVRMFTGNGTLAHAIRTARIISAVTTEYRKGNYEAALNVGKAYGALSAKKEAQQHTLRTLELDPMGRGEMARGYDGSLGTD